MVGCRAWNGCRGDWLWRVDPPRPKEHLSFILLPLPFLILGSCADVKAAAASGSRSSRMCSSEWTREHCERQAAPQDAESCAADHELERAGPEEQRRGDGPN
jgi:hypothetical protein